MKKEIYKYTRISGYSCDIFIISFLNETNPELNFVIINGKKQRGVTMEKDKFDKIIKEEKVLLNSQLKIIN
jgi:hypothetical protein